MKVDMCGSRDLREPVVLTWDPGRDTLQVEFWQGTDKEGRYVAMFVYDDSNPYEDQWEKAYKTYRRFRDRASADLVYFLLVNTDLGGQPLPGLSDEWRFEE